MHIWFRRLGQTEYIEVVAEDRTQSAENPRTFLVAKKTFRTLDGLLEAAEQAGVSEQGLTDLNVFAQQHLRSIEGSSGDLSISKEELQRIGFPPMERSMRTFLVSIVPEASDAEQITVRASLHNPPPGGRPEPRERSFSRTDLDDTLALIDRKVSDLFDPRLGKDVPKNARFNAEDVHTLFFRW
jgi:hypothetical protein